MEPSWRHARMLQTIVLIMYCSGHKMWHDSDCLHRNVVNSIFLFQIQDTDVMYLDAIVIDGNMKNYRDVCFAVNAGYVEYNGLPGRVRTRCQNAPQYMSHCCVHSPVAVPQNIQPDEDAPNPSTTATREDHVGLTVNKRVTQRSTLYEVSIQCSYYFTLA